MIKRIWLLGILILLGITSVTMADYDTSVNLMTVNPDFEAGTSGWYTARGTIDNSISQHGLHSGKLPAENGEKCDWRSQGYSPVVAGQSYQLRFWYRTSEAATGNPQIRFRFFSGSMLKGEYVSQIDRTDGQWAEILIPYTCPAGATYLDLFFTLNTFGQFRGTAWLDNVRIYGEKINHYYPEDGSVGWNNELTLRWDESENATSYQVYLGTNPDAVEHDEVTFQPGDINLDLYVDWTDLTILANTWLSVTSGVSGLTGDINNDGITNGYDFCILANDYLQNNPPPETWLASTKEPSYSLVIPETDVNYYWRVDKMIDGHTEKGNILQFQCNDYLDYNLNVPQQIFYIDRSLLSTTQLVMFQTLQGLVARDQPTLFIRTDSNALWLTDLSSRYGISNINISNVSGTISPLNWALIRYSSHYDGYILCDADNDPDSLSAAVSLAAALPSAIVCDITDESILTGIGKVKLMDVRGLDEKWVWDNYNSAFTKEAIFVQRNDIHSQGAYLRDLPVAIKALSWWQNSLTDTEEIFSHYLGNIPCYGWDSAVKPGEDSAVEYHSQHGMYTVPSDWMLNLTLYSSMSSKRPALTFKQPCSDSTYTPEENVHYVAFCMSDMDNINTLFDARGWAQGNERFGNSHRGQFAMGWGMPPIMTKLGPTVMKWWYDHATENDCFIGYCSGLDYFIPSDYSQMQLQMSHLNTYLKSADLKTLCIIDYVNGTLSPETYPVGYYYSKLENLRGFFLAYDQQHGQIAWYDGKPLVSARYCLWNSSSRSGISSNAEELAGSINALPTDPTSENGYTFVIVHAWSYGWDEVAQCISLLNNNVRVVTPNELIEQLYLHHVEP